jgi:hypothetical protein
MRNVEKNKRVLGGLALLGVIGGLGSACNLPGRNYFKAFVVKAAVNAQLPPGSKRSQVVALLDAQGVEHSGYHGKGELAVGKPVQGIIRDTAWGFVGSADMELYFRFDAGGKLTRYTFNEILTGP